MSAALTPAEFADAMRACAASDRGDEEDRHIFADELMCDLLTELGYHEGVAVFTAMNKWYS